jgi:hypothetical protein
MESATGVSCSTTAAGMGWLREQLVIAWVKPTQVCVAPKVSRNRGVQCLGDAVGAQADHFAIHPDGARRTKRLRRFRLLLRSVTAKQLALLGCISALGVTGCGSSGGGSASLKLGEVVSLSREGDAGNSTATAFKYKTAVTSVRQAGPDDLRGETVLGGAPKDDVAYYVTQRVTGVQANYSGWDAEPPDVYDSSGSQATPLETGSDLPKCVGTKVPAGFGPGHSFTTCDVYLLPPGEHVGKVVLAAEGPGQNDVTWKTG